MCSIALDSVGRPFTIGLLEAHGDNLVERAHVSQGEFSTTHPELTGIREGFHDERRKDLGTQMSYPRDAGPVGGPPQLAVAAHVEQFLSVRNLPKTTSGHDKHRIAHPLFD